MVQRQFDIAALSTRPGHRAGGCRGPRVRDPACSRTAARRRGLTLISTLLAAEEQGDPADPRRVREPGAEPARRGSGHHPEPALAGAPAVRRAPRAVGAAGRGPDTYVKRAVQEALRFEPIAPFTARIVLEDIEHRGVLFPAGTIVAVCAERANRETPRRRGVRHRRRPGRQALHLRRGRALLPRRQPRPGRPSRRRSPSSPRGCPTSPLAGDPVLGGIEGIYDAAAAAALVVTFASFGLYRAVFTRSRLRWRGSRPRRPR